MVTICRHKRRRLTDRVQCQLDRFGVPIRETAKLVYECCGCGKEIFG